MNREKNIGRRGFLKNTVSVVAATLLPARVFPEVPISKERSSLMPSLSGWSLFNEIGNTLETNGSVLRSKELGSVVFDGSTFWGGEPVYPKHALVSPDGSMILHTVVHNEELDLLVPSDGSSPRKIHDPYRSACFDNEGNLFVLTHDITSDFWESGNVPQVQIENSEHSHTIPLPALTQSTHTENEKLKALFSTLYGTEGELSLQHAYRFRKGMAVSENGAYIACSAEEKVSMDTAIVASRFTLPFSSVLIISTKEEHVSLMRWPFFRITPLEFPQETAEAGNVELVGVLGDRFLMSFTKRISQEDYAITALGIGSISDNALSLGFVLLPGFVTSVEQKPEGLHIKKDSGDTVVHNKTIAELPLPGAFSLQGETCVPFKFAEPCDKKKVEPRLLLEGNPLFF